MAHVRILSDRVANQIAAGEVVEQLPPLIRIDPHKLRHVLERAAHCVRMQVRPCCLRHALKHSARVAEIPLLAALGYDPIRNRIGEGYLMGGEEV